MIIQILSSNPFLYDILNKNPETDFGLYVKPHRNGYLIGMVGENIFNLNNKYQVIFQDTKYSYGHESNQIDFMSMCSPLIPLTVCKEFFSHLFKDEWFIPWLDKSTAEVDVYDCQLIVNHIWIESNWVRDGEFLLSRYIKGLTVFQKGMNLYKLVIDAKSITEALNLLALASFLISLSNDEQITLTKELAVKYAKILVSTSAPYFVYYLFIKRLSKQMFDACKDILEAGYVQNFGGTVSFTPHDTHQKRINFIRGQLDFSKPILDYGCGEFRYTKAFSRDLTTLFSFDKEDYSELYEKWKDRYSFEWTFTTNEADLPFFVDQIILSEVIEHNENPRLIVDYLLHRCKKMIITTPNKAFNDHYGIELRHEDHVKEYTKEELQELLPEFKIIPVGDVINNEPITFAAIYEVD